MKKDTLILVIIVVIVIAIIIGINYVKGNGNYSNETMQCIADNSILIVSKTCSHCENQRSILGDSEPLFNIIFIDEQPEVMDQYDLRAVPTWIINNEKITGVQSVEKLKELTGCQ